MNQTKQPEFRAGDMVRVRGFSGVACWYVGPQMEPGSHEVVCWECDGTGDGTDDVHGEPLRCEVCAGTNKIYDEEPEPIETGRALVVMVGDDKRHAVNYEDLLFAVDPDEVCSCGAIGCCSANNTMGGG
jgi:hypothetical protein